MMRRTDPFNVLQDAVLPHFKGSGATRKRGKKLSKKRTSALEKSGKPKRSGKKKRRGSKATPKQLAALAKGRAKRKANLKKEGK